MTPTCIIIAGPTAVGKTAAAIEVAQHFSTKIISADSRQCYRELNIGVAKPSPAELEAVPHYFINSHTVTESFSAADYERYALEKAGEIFQQNDIAVMVGGTGLYIRAFCDGLDEIPAIDEKTNQYVLDHYTLHGMEWLQEQIKTADPAFQQYGETKNPHRLIRALGVALATGRSILSFQSKEKKARNFNMIKIGLELPRQVLYERINNRVDQMMADGLEQEVKDLLPCKDLNALQTVGYRELFQYLDKQISLEKAVDLIKQHTRHYAKRQLTWFKREEAMQWMEPGTPVVQELEKKLGGGI